MWGTQINLRTPIVLESRMRRKSGASTWILESELFVMIWMIGYLPAAADRVAGFSCATAGCCERMRLGSSRIAKPVSADTKEPTMESKMVEPYRLIQPGLGSGVA